jgi:FtsP/CotA-like multicopper oxidase with cupredoxin domain
MSSRLSRRTLLAGVAALPALAVLGCESDRTTADPISTVNTLDFANRLRIPELADSTVDGDGVRVFRLGATAGSAEFLNGVATPTWGYTDGHYAAGYLGPTLRAARGEQVRVLVENRLSESPPCTGTACTFRLAMTVARTSPSRPGSNGNRPGRSISLRRPCGITRIRTAKPNPR